MPWHGKFEVALSRVVETDSTTDGVVGGLHQRRSSRGAEAAHFSGRGDREVIPRRRVMASGARPPDVSMRCSRHSTVIYQPFLCFVRIRATVEFAGRWSLGYRRSRQVGTDQMPPPCS